MNTRSSGINNTLSSTKSMENTSGQKKEGIRVHSASLFTEMLKVAEYIPKRYEEEHVAQLSGDDILRENIRIKKKIREEQYKEQFIKAKKDAERRLLEKQKKKEDAFQLLYETLMHERETFVKEIGYTLEMKEKNDQRKKEQLYKEWCEKVFNPIQMRIQATLDAIPTEEIEARRLKMFDAFLEATNTKLGVFRDIIIESDYDPLASRSHYIRYNTSDLKDPVKKPITKDIEEQKMALPPEQLLTKKTATTGRTVPTRETLDVKLWDKIDSTPHGHYSKIYANEEKRGFKPKEASTKLRSTVTFDHYNYDTSHDTLKKELPPGKRMFPNIKQTFTVNDQRLGLDE